MNPPTKRQTQKVMGKLFEIPEVCSGARVLADESDDDDRKVLEYVDDRKALEYQYDVEDLDKGFQDVERQRSLIMNRCLLGIFCVC